MNHAWNQVKIDDQWYNVDLTWDRAYLFANNYNYIARFCLLKDKALWKHLPISGDYESCDFNYDVSVIEKLFTENLSPMTVIKYVAPKKINKNVEKQKQEETKQEELNSWDLRKYEKNVIEDKQNKQHKTREKEELER